MFAVKDSAHPRAAIAFSAGKGSEAPARAPTLALMPRPPRHTREAYGLAGVEPALSEVLADPLVHLVMARDNLTAGQVACDLHLAAARLRRRDGADKM